MKKLIQKNRLIVACSLCAFANIALADTATMKFTGRVLASSCTIQSPANVTVLLGSRNAHSDFFGVGTATPWVNFAINLQCPAGLRVSSQIDATADSSLAPGVMRLNTETGMATGVGVQMYLDTTPEVAVTFGQPVVITTTTAQGPVNINYKARYYQTASTITTGPANATAQYTLSYQ